MYTPTLAGGHLGFVPDSVSGSLDRTTNQARNEHAGPGGPDRDQYCVTGQGEPGDNRNQPERDQSWSVREARIMLNMVELKLQVDNGTAMTGGQCDDHGVRMRCRTMD